MRNIVFVILVGMLFLTACGGNEPSSDSNESAAPAAVPADYAGRTNPFGAEAAAQGAEVFRTNCEMCHGAQGHGDGPAGQALEPKPGNLAELQAQVGDDYLLWRISEGKPGTSMVAWKGILTEQQIWQTISFLHALE